MSQDSNERPDEPGTGKQSSGRLAQGLLIVAIMVLIAIALVSFH
jgi:hypothetical protein